MLVGVDLASSGSSGSLLFDPALEELGLLAQSAGMEPVARVACRRKAPDPSLFIGSGKADEIRDLARDCGALEVLFDQNLSPAQQRNLERHLGLPVNDRTFLILGIFAQRARSHEGKLQVELARLQYLSTRLVRRWSHLERQSGGIGMRGGPGESQIELDRRMIADGIRRIQSRLSRVKRQRATQRRQRQRHGMLCVSLVGYTNAGKSTLFNALVKAGAFAADQLFATLDTTTRKLYLGCAQPPQPILLSDTVGFIRDLPHGLVDAFEATLQEAVDADLLLHIVDYSDPHHIERIAQVQTVLEEIGAGDIPQVLVFNKVDAVGPERRPGVLRDTYEWGGSWVPRTFVSAHSGEGLPGLRQVLCEKLFPPPRESDVPS
ncbi:GTPase HflX [Candidatus Symbiobacter mobilis]|uniref:GTPase HflX n=1 Tax=Candidatus Symbiobacter mobilis CR TaxID=946483 RepID=U5NCW1_9BURK|nr:GTPase HflX [Candidatus Symbiobacter mobilis]AGX88078.1 GTP-binding protein HflX [Candidatus Symbiobacter mobilis CR]